MYYLTIDDEDVKQLHKTVKVDDTFTISEILSSTSFHIENYNNDLYKICPLFYCDEITSTNNSDKIFGNQCIITKYDGNTVYLFKSENFIKNILIYPLIIADDCFILFYDKATLKPLKDVTVAQSENGLEAVNNIGQDIISDLDLTFDNFENHDAIAIKSQVSDRYGLVRFDINIGNCFEISYNGISTTLEVL